jgi:hypothetical protein
MRPKSLGAVCVCFCLLVATIVAGRILPHSWNMMPAAGAALFSGFLFRRRLVALAVPIVGLLVSDWVIGFYDWRVMVAVYVGLTLPVLLAPLLSRLTALRLLGCCLAASVMHFVITNAAVWAFQTIYPHNFAGLVECFAAAIPYFRNDVAGDLAWTAAFFGTYAIVAAWQAHRQTATARALEPIAR